MRFSFGFGPTASGVASKALAAQRCLVPCAVLALAGVGWAQGESITLNYPSGVPWDALQPKYDPPSEGCPLVNPVGYPNCCSPCLSPGPWVSLATIETGFIDDDEYLDYLVVMSERLVMAFGIDDYDADGKPTSTAQLYVIWAWFDPEATFYRAGTGTDKGSIADFDGDGDQEVAVVVGKPKNYSNYDQVTLPPFPSTITGDPRTQKRLMIFGVDSTPVLDPNPDFLGVPLPEILGWRWLNDNSCDPHWSEDNEPSQIGLMNGDTFRVLAADFSEGPGMDLMVHSTTEGRAKVFAWNGTMTGFTEILCRDFGYNGLVAATHEPHAFDINGDGYDELLDNGVVDVHNNQSWTFLSTQYLQGKFQQCGTSGNHIDSMVPIDTDDNGSYETLYAANHECYDLLVEIDPNNPGTPPTQVYENDDDSRICELYDAGTYEPYKDGQSVFVVKLLADEGPLVLLTPKEWDGLFGPNDLSSIVTRPQPNACDAIDEVTYNHDIVSSSVFNGPTQFGPANLDWDGDRSADEIFSRWGSTIYRLTSGVYFPETCNENNPHPTEPYPFVWSQLFQYNEPHYDYRVVDAFGDYRDEVVILGGSGLALLYNETELSNSYQHLPPLTRDSSGEFVETSYARRLNGYQARPLDYQDLHMLDRLEVKPFTPKLALNGQVQYQALLHYVDASGHDFAIDVTDDVTWTSGNLTVASFSGSTLTAHQYGYAAVRASLPEAGIVNDGPALAVVSNVTQPIILYAGWDDTYAVEGASSTVRAIARVVGSLKWLYIPGVGNLKDDGLDGDRVAGDKIFTWEGSADEFGSTPSDQYVEIFASKQNQIQIGVPLTLQGKLWPYLTVGQPQSQPAPTVGYPSFPWASEADGFGPRLAGVGYGLTALTPNVAGTVTFFAVQSDDEVEGISAWAFSDGVTMTNGINDSGTGADQIAGDGLWTGTAELSLPAGNYTTDLLPYQLGPVNTGDAHPRLRIHE